MNTANSTGLNLGAIGNGRALALVDEDCRIIWWCAPRFDSPSVFGKLLDDQQGGSFEIEPIFPAKSKQREYIRNTNCLRTRVESAEGIFEIIDFAPWLSHAHRPDNPLEIHRLVRPLQGTPRIRVHFDPRPEYGANQPTLIPFPRGIIAQQVSGRVNIYLTMNAPSASVLAGTPVLLDRPRTFTLSYGMPSACTRADETHRRLEETIWLWRSWVKSIALPGIEDEAVIRSALALRLHMYDDTGAIIAAATTSIPESLGTGRNWDYRYCWIRDASYVVEAFSSIGLLFEGEKFLDFLRTVASAELKNLQPVYGLAGESQIEEKVVPSLRGYRGHGPVRVGNAAAQQVQHDVYGGALLALHYLLSDPRIVRDDRGDIFKLLCRLVDSASQAHPKMDTGIWEFRTKLRHYTYSKVMCWLALDLGSKIADREGRQELANPWRKEAAALREEILTRGYNSKLGFFTQALDGEFPDASNLLFARLGLISAKDPRFISTVKNYERLLVRNGLMLRYTNEDDFGQTTSAFLLCSFWWAEALALIGEVERAKEVFHSLLARATPLGLFSEDIDPHSGERLGNFPQAYTHVGVIRTAGAIATAQKAHAH